MQKTHVGSVHVLGPGALGLIFAHQFSADTLVTVITKSTHPTRYLYCVNNKSEPVSACFESNIDKPIEELWLFTKAHQAKATLAELRPHLLPNANIILSHNGMTDVAELEALLSDNQGLFFMLTQQAAFKPATNTVVHVSNGPSMLGAINSVAQQRLHSCYKLWQKRITQLEKSTDIQGARWRKLLVNIAINPVAAYYRKLNGELRAPEYASDIMALMVEAVMVANLEGVKISLAEALDNAYKVMANTAENSCSTLQDINQGRETEIDAICGYIAKLAQHYGLAAPVNELYYQRIKGGIPSPF